MVRHVENVEAQTKSSDCHADRVSGPENPQYIMTAKEASDKLARDNNPKIQMEETIKRLNNGVSIRCYAEIGGPDKIAENQAVRATIEKNKSIDRQLTIAKNGDFDFPSLKIDSLDIFGRQAD